MVEVLLDEDPSLDCQPFLDDKRTGFRAMTNPFFVLALFVFSSYRRFGTRDRRFLDQIHGITFLGTEYPIGISNDAKNEALDSTFFILTDRPLHLVPTREKEGDGICSLCYVRTRCIVSFVNASDGIRVRTDGATVGTCRKQRL